MYYLMNKDIKIAEFDVLGEGEFEYLKIIGVDKCRLYPWISNLSGYIAHRRAPKHREHIQELLSQCGCGSISGFLSVSHALSLNDTIWVKKDCEKDLTWSRVSLYTNDFNKTIAKIAFDGDMFEKNLSTTSPEFGTDGAFAKCWIREDNIIKLVKKGSSGARNAGLEPYSEFYVSQVLEALNLRHVDYSLTNKYSALSSKCDLFTSEDYGFVPFSALATSYMTLGEIFNWYHENGFCDYFAEMLVADSLIANEDRHVGNFGFLFDNRSGKIIDTAPLFDHNISMFCYGEEDDFKDLYGYIRSLNKGLRLGGDFISVARQVLTPSLRKRLINMKGFKLKKHSRYNLPDYKIDALSKFINNQINYILS